MTRNSDEEIVNNFYNYLKQYILMITENLDNYFIAISDIEYDLLEGVRNKKFKGYEVAFIDRKEYSTAVSLRNDIKFCKIVLLSSDSIKRIDSLKDFNEHSIKPEDNELFWDIIMKTFDIIIDDDERKFINCLMEKKRFSLSTLLKYINLCNDNRMLNHRKMKQNLNLFGCWKTNDDNLKIVDLKKIIRASEPNEIDKRISDTISNGGLNKIRKDKRNRLLSHLMSNDYEALFQMLSYEDVLECFAVRNGKRISAKTIDENTDFVEQYLFSYDYLINESDESINITDLELCIKQNPEEDDITTHFKDILQAFENDTINGELFEGIDSYFKELEYQVEMLNLPKAKKDKLEKMVNNFINEVSKVIKIAPNLTPVLLDDFCIRTNDLCNSYFKILSYILTDDDVAESCSGTSFIEALQTTLCQKTDRLITLSYLHPIAIFYFNYLRELYVTTKLLISSDCSELKKCIIIGLLNQERIKIPIKFIQFNREIYSFDYSLLNYPTRFDFQLISDLTNNSSMDFRIITKDIFRYIEENKYLPEINVTIVGVSDLSGITLLLNRIIRKKEAREFILNRINLNIVSANEINLKEQIKKWFEKVTDNNFVQFKFTYQKYYSDNMLDLSMVINDSDIVYLADTGIIYKKERLTKYLDAPNSMMNDIIKFDLQKQINNYLNNRNCAVNIIWESLHNIINYNDNCLSIWKNKEIDNNVLLTINLAIKQNNILSVVLLSSNIHLINTIHLTELYTARIDKSCDKDILILDFNSNAKRRNLSKRGKLIVRVPIRPFLESLIDTDELDNIFKSLDSNEKTIDNIYIKIELFNGRIITSCIIGLKEECNEDNSIDNDLCRDYVKDILSISFTDKNILNCKFKEIFINEMYQNSNSYAAALLTYYVDNYFIFKNIEISEIEERYVLKKNNDSANIIEFQKIMEFFHMYSIIDESAVELYKRWHSKNILRKIIHINRDVNLLPKHILDNMNILYEIIIKEVDYDKL